MRRKIIQIDEALCDGCGECIDACHEGAIELIEGRARLVSEVYCDGLGDCVGECPRGAITLEEREALDYDQEAVDSRRGRPEGAASPCASGGCPGAAPREMPATAEIDAAGPAGPSRLGNWPVQLRLAHPLHPALQGADLLVCADCAPFTLPGFHQDWLDGRRVVVGCPKLDDLAEMHQRLAGIFRHARPRSITVLRMEVPCCGGIAQAARQARDAETPATPLEVVTVSVQGEILRREALVA